MKWSGLALTVLLLTAWIASAWWTLVIGWNLKNEAMIVQIEGGSARFNWFDQPWPAQSNSLVEVQASGFTEDCRQGVAWRWFEFRWFAANSVHLAVPAWTPFAIMTAIAALAWWRVEHAKRRAGCCRRCGYSGSGRAADSRCPECGAELS